MPDRQSTIRRTLFVAVMVASVVAPLPVTLADDKPAPTAMAMPALDNTPLGRTAWEIYARALLHRLYPAEAPALGNRPVVVVDSPIPNAKRTGSFIVFNWELITVPESEAEFAAVLGHEFSHLFRNHQDTQLWSDFLVPAGHDMVLLERQETEADRDSLMVLRRAGLDPCAAATMLGHIIDGYSMRARPDEPHFALTLRREAALKRDCKASP